jgi:hypothetical protein
LAHSLGNSVSRAYHAGRAATGPIYCECKWRQTSVKSSRTDVTDLSAIGVAHLAGASAGLSTFDSLRRLDRGAQAFKRSLAPEKTPPESSNPAARAIRGHAFSESRPDEIRVLSLQPVAAWPGCPAASTRSFETAE